jgi:flagellar biosynthesis protein FliR
MLLLVDLALALVGRINAQVQMITIAFPLKMGLSLVMLSWTLAAFPRVFEQHASRLFSLMSSLLAR